MFTYKIKEGKESKLDSVIEKSGITTNFTLMEVLNHLDFTKKTLENTNTQLSAEAMQDELAIKIVPVLSEIPEDKWQIVSAYAQRKLEKAEKDKLVEVCEETIKAYADVVDEVGKMLEIEDVEKEKEEYIAKEMGSVPSPIQAD